eukprot:gene21282-8068_t
MEISRATHWIRLCSKKGRHPYDETKRYLTRYFEKTEADFKCYGVVPELELSVEQFVACGFKPVEPKEEDFIASDDDVKVMDEFYSGFA